MCGMIRKRRMPVLLEIRLKERFGDVLNRIRNEMLVKRKKCDIAYLHDLGPDWMRLEL